MKSELLLAKALEFRPPRGQFERMQIEVETEVDGRFIAEVSSIPGAMVYGDTAEEAISKVEALVLRILADRIDSGIASPELSELFTVSA